MSSIPKSNIEVTDIRIEDWPLTQPFVISRGAKIKARVIVVEVSSMGITGRGEAVPYSRYGETPESAAALLRTNWPLDRLALLQSMPPGAARNALDCALWDLEAKLKSKTAHAIACRPAPLQQIQTCFTISLGEPDAMACEAAQLPQLTLLKLKLGGNRDDERMRAIRAARPECRLVADANEAWTIEETPALLALAAEQRFELIEQPLPAENDAVLASIKRPIPVCADESAHVATDLQHLRDRYDAVNIKLDKAGGLTEALLMHNEARKLGFKIMIGSMVATSLAAAPAMLLANDADWVDLDGPLLLARDRPNALLIKDGWISPAEPELWG